MMNSAIRKTAAIEMIIPAKAIPSPALGVTRICGRAMKPQMILAGQKTKPATRETMARVFVLGDVRA
jgi:hypothetical protein